MLHTKRYNEPAGIPFLNLPTKNWLQGVKLIIDFDVERVTGTLDIAVDDELNRWERVLAVEIIHLLPHRRNQLIAEVFIFCKDFFETGYADLVREISILKPRHKLFDWNPMLG